MLGEGNQVSCGVGNTSSPACAAPASELGLAELAAAAALVVAAVGAAAAACHLCEGALAGY